MSAQKDRVPFLSLITIVWNGRDAFAATAASVIREAPVNTEWVVVDGASTDGTVKEIEKFSSQIARKVSEKDRGIADAFNKGIKLAVGEYVLFLNAGDCLAPGAAHTLTRIAERHRGAPVISGQIEMSSRRHGKAIPFWRQYMRNQLPHQAMLIRRDLFESLGSFEAEYKLGMDFEWSLRLRRLWQDIVFVPDLITIMEPGGVSISNAEKTFAEFHVARVRHFGMPWLSSAISQYYAVRKLILKPVRPIITAYRRNRTIEKQPLRR